MFSSHRTAVILCALCSTLSNGGQPLQSISDTVKQVVETTIKNGCESSAPNPLTFHSIYLPTLNVKHLIVGADVFDVYLNEIKITGIDSAQVNVASTSPSDTVDEIDLSLRFANVAIDCSYTANGSIGQTFPVHGKGSLKIEYKNITSVLVFSMDEIMCNGQPTKSITDDGIRAKSLQYEHYLLKVSPKSSDDTSRIYRRGSSKSEGEVSQLSQLLFWKLAYLTSIKLKPQFEKCLNRHFSHCDYPSDIERSDSEQPAESVLIPHVLQYNSAINEHIANGTQTWYIPMPEFM